ncbi:hypothetical protein Pmani_019866, partial [Petrolisthes manimaculis]
DDEEDECEDGVEAGPCVDVLDHLVSVVLMAGDVVETRDTTTEEGTRDTNEEGTRDSNEEGTRDTNEEGTRDSTEH